MTSTMTSTQVPVEPVPTTPARQTFLGTVPLRTGVDRWELGGVVWVPEQTGGGGIAVVACAGNTAAQNVGTNPGQQFADPFLIWAEDHCATFDHIVRDYVGRARRQLAATESYRIAREVWAGAAAQAAVPDLDNAWLTKDPTSVGTNVAVGSAVGLIDQAVSEMLFGARGMLHMSPQVLGRAAAAQAVRLNGTVWETPMGTPVVADAGYSGAGPDGGGSTKQWIYGTAPMVYYQSPVVTVPDILDSPESWAFATDWTVNDVTVRASRMVLVQWDYAPPTLPDDEMCVGVETDVASWPGFS
jgi:hypothetical protein